MPKYPLTEHEQKILEKYINEEPVENKVYLRLIRKRIREMDPVILQLHTDIIKDVLKMEEST